MRSRFRTDGVAAAVRLPAMINGNGKDIVRQLIERWSRRRMAATGGESRVPMDAETERCVRDAGYGMDDCLPEVLQLAVRKTANLRIGGTIHDVTHDLSCNLSSRGRGGARSTFPWWAWTSWYPRWRGKNTSSLKPTSVQVWPITSPSPRQRFVDLLFPETARTQESPTQTP
jgi:hypothetical protein